MEQNGEFTPTRLEDVLVKAIGKSEHAWRTRGVGSYVGLPSYFGKPTTPSGRIYTEEDVRLLIEKVKRETKEEVKRETMEDINVIVEKKWAEMMGKFSLSNGQDHSSCHSTHHDPFVELKEPASFLSTCCSFEQVIDRCC